MTGLQTSNYSSETHKYVNLRPSYIVKNVDIFDTNKSEHFLFDMTNQNLQKKIASIRKGETWWSHEEISISLWLM